MCTILFYSGLGTYAGQFSRGIGLGLCAGWGGNHMRLSRILLFMGALALAAVPAAAQGRGVGKPAGVGKPTTTAVKGASGTVTKGKSVDAKGGTLAKGKSEDAKSGSLAKGKSADAKGPKTTTTDADTPDTGGDIDTASEETKGRGQLPLNEKIAMNDTLKARLEALLPEGGTLNLDTAATGWRNQGQLVAAMNAAERQGISFEALRIEMVENQKSLPDAIAAVKAAATTTTTAAGTTTTATGTTTTP